MPAEGVHRPAWAEVSRSALRHNLAEVQRVVAPAAVCAVVKANGYGHGAVIAAKAFIEGGAAGLAVAIYDEGVELREGGLTAPILLLAETPDEWVSDAFEQRLTLTVGSLDGARSAAAAARALGGRHRVHLKVDTGMHRVGVTADELDAVLDVLANERTLQVEGIYTHFAIAESEDPTDRAYCALQLEQFEAARERARHHGIDPPVVHAANSAAALSLPEAWFTMVRAGLALYGYSPGPEGVLKARGVSLRPALSLVARVSAVRRLAAGERPSYGRRRALVADATVATVPFGYADGFPRRMLDAGATVLVNGHPRGLAGTVTMDQLVLDCDDDDVHVGDLVTLIGRVNDEAVTADDWARWCGTISWEVLCAIGARVPRVAVA